MASLDLQIIITGVTVTATSFDGTVTNFPLPLDVTQTLGLPGTGLLFDATTTPPGIFSGPSVEFPIAPVNVQLVGVTVAFIKLP